MKCPECQRRNSDTNSFCISCGAQLARSLKKSKTLMPPQDILSRLGSRKRQLPQFGFNFSPIVVIMLIIIIGLGATYYTFYQVDTYQVQAIDHQVIYD